MSRQDKEHILIADSDALDRFIKTENTHVFAELYDRVIIPEQVYQELTREQSPREVREWTDRQAAAGTWLNVAKNPLNNPNPTNTRGWGEKQAIALAHEYQNSDRYESVSMLLEDRAAVQRANQQNLRVTRGLFLLAEADRRGLIQPLPEEIKRLESLPLDYKNEKTIHEGKVVPVTEVLVQDHYKQQELIRQVEITNVPGTQPDRNDFVASFPSGQRARFSVGGLAEGDNVKDLITFSNYERLGQQLQGETLNLTIASSPAQSQAQAETPLSLETQTQTQTVKF